MGLHGALFSKRINKRGEIKLIYYPRWQHEQRAGWELGAGRPEVRIALFCWDALVLHLSQTWRHSCFCSSNYPATKILLPFHAAVQNYIESNTRAFLNAFIVTLLSKLSPPAASSVPDRSFFCSYLHCVCMWIYEWISAPRDLVPKKPSTLLSVCLSNENKTKDSLPLFGQTTEMCWC